ncbi:double-strand break repair helicase AddA [Sphingomonas sinipercae]|uniref:DNA 3'-5' helicase n=1 Tax=Sphingomonas sinipercae TaxID=2714944 RepID=A0A6G7ZNX2_9SPHN|nr:double-strand break repair helicase AddA [Sphingomonas sinipercae]QIL02633.1 double-strand break repair helicase AddA [Sphingomonas sinipercae]
MSNRFKPLPQLAGAQAAAADPRAHASLSASAGTGKTQVLTARVLRLLLSGVDPEHILCLTFTKAGATEMANRIGSQLAAWVRLPDKALKKDLFALGESTDPRYLERARRLFAKVLDAPGGLRIQTIHSFAQALLASFPAEAGITPGFQPIEGRAEQELARSTLADLLADAEAAGRDQLIEDVQCLSLRLGEDGATRYLMQCAHAADAMVRLGGASEIEPALRRVMDLPDESVEDMLAASCADDRFDCDLLRAIADANRAWGAATGEKLVQSIERWLALAPADRAGALPDLALIVFTGSGDLRKVSAGQRNADPDYDAHAERLARAIGELLTIQRGARLAAEMAAGLRAGQAFAKAYSDAKRRAGVADFNDLIAWTRRLLATPGMGEWVRYKLDRRTDHILVDESQDTNAAQWQIVQALAEEFFAGAGAAGERHRTIFMVGDFKQAIFRFQGTDPEEFRRARDWVRDHSAALREAAEDTDDWVAPEFRELSIDASFRSSQAVLDAVDAVIDEVGYPNMGLPDEPNRHRAFFSDRPGLVELWKPYAPTDAQEDEPEEGWLDEEERAYATELARQVRRWLDERPLMASTGRELGPGDIMILVRSRGELASLIVARLFAERVPVAGIDRLHLHKPLAVKDLLSAVAFAVQPLDDLSLASLLVSPLIGWDQEQLRALAFGRGEISLWQALRTRSGEREDFGTARDRLASLLAMADYVTPHRFLETILSGPLDGRRKLYGRLGLAARDPIDELLSSALEFERGEIPSLDRFLAWFSRGDVEIKRDPSAPVNAVRVMTVHGAKGLEAPLVVLADATADPERIGGVARSMTLPIADARVPVIRPRKDERLEPFGALLDEDKRLDLEEHWRLLYVGMTRAVDRLVIAGIDKGDPAENCWHKRVERGLAVLGAEVHEDAQWGALLRYRGAVQGGRVRHKPAPRDLPLPEVPAWAKAPAPPEARPPRPLAPSALAEDREPSAPPSAAARAAAERGTLIHALLERLPPVEASQRGIAGARWLERSAGVTDAAEREAIVGLVLRILEDGRFSSLFGPGSLPEAPIVATLPDGRVIAGTVDRLLVEPGRISVIDFKTGRAPETSTLIPRSHSEQMEAYRQALQVIFPGRHIAASLLYTATGALFELGA